MGAKPKNAHWGAFSALLYIAARDLARFGCSTLRQFAPVPLAPVPPDNGSQIMLSTDDTCSEKTG